MKYNLHLKKATALAIATIFIASSSLVGCSNGSSTNIVGNQTTAERKYTITEEGVDFKMPNAPVTPAWIPEQILEADIKKEA